MQSCQQTYGKTKAIEAHVPTRFAIVHLVAKDIFATRAALQAARPAAVTRTRCSDSAASSCQAVPTLRTSGGSSRPALSSCSPAVMPSTSWRVTSPNAQPGAGELRGVATASFVCSMLWICMHAIGNLHCMYCMHPTLCCCCLFCLPDIHMHTPFLPRACRCPRGKVLIHSENCEDAHPSLGVVLPVLKAR